MQCEQTIEEIIKELDKFQLEVAAKTGTYDQLRVALAERLNFLITNNFSLLISILYRLDISENKLKQLLSSLKEVPAGDIIAELIITRQLQKIALRNAFNQEENIPDNEKW